MLTLFKFLFCVIKTHIIDLIQLVLIKIRFNIFRCFLLGTYFLVLLQEDFINCAVNNIVILLLPVKFISVYGIVPAVLVGLILAYLEPKYPRTLNSYDDWMGPWMIHVGLYLSFGLSPYIFLLFQRSHSSHDKYLTRRLLLYLAFCNQHGWNLP